jgi:hypothetical protein
MSKSNKDEAAWDLARDCLDVLPYEDLQLSGRALVHIMSLWLNAHAEGEGRVMAYMDWLSALHVQLTVNNIMNIKTEVHPAPATVH